MCEKKTIRDYVILNVNTYFLSLVLEQKHLLFMTKQFTFY